MEKYSPKGAEDQGGVSRVLCSPLGGSAQRGNDSPIKGRGRANSSLPQGRREFMLIGMENRHPGPRTLSTKVIGREVIWGSGVILVGQTN